MLMSQSSLVIIPTFNVRENLPSLVERIMSQPGSFEVLVVDDHSPDGTGELADTLAATNPRVHVLHRSEKNGLGRAYCDGFKWALDHDYDFIYEMDGDFSHNPDDLPLFLKAAQDADLVLGSRYSNGIRVINWPLKRLLLSMGAAKYVQIITGLPFSDPTGGYKCFRRRALESIDLDAVQSNGYSFQIELTHKIWRQGMTIAEVPIIYTDRVSRQFQTVRKDRSGSLGWSGVYGYRTGSGRKPHLRPLNRNNLGLVGKWDVFPVELNQPRKIPTGPPKTLLSFCLAFVAL